MIRTKTAILPSLTLLATASVLALGSALPAAQTWPDEHAAGPFLCHSDFPLGPHPVLLAQTAQLQRDLTRMLGVGPPREAIHLFLFHNKATYEQYIQHYFPNTARRRALFIKGQGPGMVFAYVSHNLGVDLRHECTHALLHASLPLVPLWLDEGLAEYFEAPPEQRVSQSVHLAAVKWRAKLGQPPQLEELENLGRMKNMGRSEYRDAWAWTHFMLHGPPAARSELLRFLADLQAHVPPGRLSQRLRQRLPDLETLVVEHFRNWPP